MSAAAHPHCPDCGAGDLRDLGRLPDVAVFAMRKLDAPLPGGRLLHCPRCDLRLRHPILSAAEYDALYDNARADVWAASDLRVDQALVKGLIETRPGARSVLDFGCYSGALLAALPASMHKYGVEVNAAAALAAARNSGARVESSIDAFESDLSFDVIVLMDVIEHVASPRALAAKLLARLAPGGALLVTTGDGGNWLWRLLKGRWWYCYWPEHIAFVSRRWVGHHAPALRARIERADTFNYLDDPRGARQRWKAIARYVLRPGYDARKRARINAETGRDDGVPGIGLTRDHLLLVLGREAASTHPSPATPAP